MLLYTARAVTRCKDIRLLVGESVVISDYVEPLLSGKTITFTCPPGMELTGHNTTTCMENGEWEPDPREVICNGKVRFLMRIACS